MKSKLRMAVTLLAVSSVAITCTTDKNLVRVTDRNFSEEVELLQNLSFTFDRSLAPDSAIGRWDSVQYIAFTPAIRGMFKWNKPNELVFSPFAPLRISTDYKAQFTGELTSVSLTRFNPPEEIISFHTPYLQLQSMESYWEPSKNTPGKLAVNLVLVFNYKVDPSEVKPRLLLKLNEAESPFEMVTQIQEQKIQVRADNIPKDFSKQHKAGITINTGLPCPGSEYKTKETLSLGSVLSPPEKLSITLVEPQFEGLQPFIRVSSNQQVEAANLNDFIKIDPPVTFMVDRNESGFDVRGNFVTGSAYELKVLKGLEGMIGDAMANDYITTVSFGNLQPRIVFSGSKGVYLSTKSSRKLGVNIINVPKVHLTVYKIYENNILNFMQHNRYRDYDYYGDGEYTYSFEYSDYNLNGVGDLVMDQDYETKNLQKQNGIHYLSLDFSDELAFRGIYLVKVSSTEDRWLRSMKMVSVSDIGFIVKEGIDETTVFVNSIMTAEPSRNVKVNFVSTNNQVLRTVTTNEKGVAVFKSSSRDISDFRLGMITAHSKGDFNFLMLSDSRVETSRYDVGGRRENSSGMQAFLYGDREIYRPGENVYVQTIVRNESWMPVSELPVKMKVLLPNGKEFLIQKKNLSAQGACEFSFSIPVSSVTGTYNVELYASNDVLLADRRISVEEFIPDRINVKVTLDKNEYTISDSIKVSASAVNLFGPPAADRNYEMEFTLAKKQFYAKEYAGYNFLTRGHENIPLPRILRQGKTDKEGNAKEIFQAESRLMDAGLLDGKIYVTVFDETGRPVNRVQQFNLYTQNIFYGTRLVDYYVTRGQSVLLKLIAVNSKGKAVNERARVQLFKRTWHTSIERSYGNYRYVSNYMDELMSDREENITAQGKEISFVPNESGQYFVRVSEPGNSHFVEEEFYCYGYHFTQSTAFEVDNEGRVDIVSDKEKYQPGSKASLLFKTPFAGTLLVTIERGKLYEYHYLETDKKAASLSIDIKEDYLPNIYVSATLFRPLDDGSMPLTVAHGVVSLSVEKPVTRLPLTIIAPSKSRSKTKQTVKIKTIPRADVEMTVAVIDEGIMQIKDSKTPDPHAFFYGKKALEVNSYDVYPFVLPDVSFKKSSVAGDGYDLQKRVNPMSNKRVKLVALWSGTMKTNSSGEAEYAFNIPQFSGDLRVMAVAWNNNSFAGADKHIKVADPIVISPTIPRFLSPGDTITMPVNISNTTSKNSDATVAVKVSGNLDVIGQENIASGIEANSESRVVFKVAAKPEPGLGSIEVKVNALGENFSDVTDITIRPAASLLKLSSSGFIEGGKSEMILLKNNFIPESTEGKLLVSRSPLVQFSDHMIYLLDYPYGCVEQTVSIAFPQLYYSSLMKSIKNKPGFPVNYTRNIEGALQRLVTMQMYDGALSYWPGGDYSNRWGSVYAAHFVLEAQKAGFQVNKNFSDRLLNYLSQMVRSKADEEIYYYMDDNYSSYKTKKVPAKDIFYGLYLLANSGKADLSTMNYYKTAFSSLALDSKYMLAITYLAAGDRKSYAELLPKAFEGEYSKRCTGGSFYSYTRDLSFSLNALLETDPQSEQVGIMVQHLSQQLRKQKWLSTQERSFAFLALGKFMKQNANNTVTASLSANGKPLGKFSGSDVVLRKGISNETVEVTTLGAGRLYWFWEMEGLSKDGAFKPEDNFLKVRKSFYNRFGQPVQSKTFKQNELVVIKITLENKERSRVENIVVSDMLPAGFEIENPRITALPGMEWIKDSANPQYMDMRDDRIHFFTSVSDRPVNFYYLVRAVSPGKFVMGPVSADAMYDGEYHSVNGAGVVTVTQ